eukprot:TRINITY_DN27103_c0_g1_i1.p1 TRINITY_DN27103_c0_g1~~TRINITY_DN27103_c0_g1_i1.p1  ORF type:complete len:528 (+),score=105.64 TRINITY_DN27103_c0_g1_i1:70-1584(+)
MAAGTAPSRDPAELRAVQVQQVSTWLEKHKFHAARAVFERERSQQGGATGAVLIEELGAAAGFLQTGQVASGPLRGQVAALLFAAGQHFCGQLMRAGDHAAAAQVADCSAAFASDPAGGAALRRTSRSKAPPPAPAQATASGAVLEALLRHCDRLRLVHIPVALADPAVITVLPPPEGATLSGPGVHHGVAKRRRVAVRSDSAVRLVACGRGPGPRACSMHGQPPAVLAACGAAVSRHTLTRAPSAEGSTAAKCTRASGTVLGLSAAPHEGSWGLACGAGGFVDLLRLADAAPALAACYAAPPDLLGAGGRGACWGCEFDPAAPLLFAAACGSGTALWRTDVPTSPLRVLTEGGSAPGSAVCCTFASHGMLLTGGSAGLTAWDPRRRTAVTRMPLSGGTQLISAGKGDFIVAAAECGGAVLWDARRLSSGAVLRAVAPLSLRLDGNPPPARALAMRTDGELAAAWPGLVGLWNDTNAEWSLSAVPAGNCPGALCWAPTGLLAVV